MKKNVLMFAFACVLGTAASFISVNNVSAKTAPECSMSICSGGSQNCCSEGGVTLYKNPKD